MSRGDAPIDIPAVVYCSACGGHWRRPTSARGARLMCGACGVDLRRCPNPRTCFQAKVHGIGTHDLVDVVRKER